MLYILILQKKYTNFLNTPLIFVQLMTDILNTHFRIKEP